MSIIFVQEITPILFGDHKAAWFEEDLGGVNFQYAFVETGDGDYNMYIEDFILDCSTVYHSTYEGYSFTAMARPFSFRSTAVGGIFNKTEANIRRFPLLRT